MAIQSSLLENDQLLMEWLRCFIDFSTGWNPQNKYAGPQLLFDSTHENVLRERTNCHVDGILMTVQLAKKLQYGNRIQGGTSLAGNLFELVLLIVTKLLWVLEKRLDMRRGILSNM